MSEGTRDQLYLALRLATLEQHLDGGEPVPFVVDDILVGFDDTRTDACLRVLSELAARTQVLLFTHHKRVAEIALGLGEESRYLSARSTQMRFARNKTPGAYDRSRFRRRKSLTHNTRYRARWAPSGETGGSCERIE